jgi:hypothetical protein
VKAKGKVCLLLSEVPCHDLLLHSFVTSTLDGDEKLASLSDCLTPFSVSFGKVRGLVGYEAGLDLVSNRKICARAWNRAPVVA